MNPLTRFLVLAITCTSSLIAGTTPKPTPDATSQETVTTSEPGNGTLAARRAALGRSVVRVSSTNQSFQFTRPWAKRPPLNRRGIGIVLDSGKILVTAELVSDSGYVELELPATSEKCPASVELIDYDCNLALLQPQDPKFLETRKPTTLASNIVVGDHIDILQLESNGEVALSAATVTSIEVAGYPSDGIGLLVYKVSAPIQYRDNSFTVPCFAEEKFAGMLMRYDSRSQTAELVPAPVIEAFLARAKESPYLSFPRLGVIYASTRDPQFREALGLTKPNVGIYISQVLTGSAAEKGGLKKGDVILSVEGETLDQDGNYAHPQLGRISFSHLISTERQPGGSFRAEILRDGKPIELEIPLEPRDPAAIISETQIRDAQPRYVVIGGLVFQELSRSYLKEWGNDWQANAPQKLVYLDLFQDELPADRGKIVFISQVLPTDATIGYEDLNNLVVEKFNGSEIKSLEDIVAAAESPEGEFHRIEIDGDPGVIFLDAAQAKSEQEMIQQTYGLPALEFLSD